MVLSDTAMVEERGGGPQRAWVPQQADAGDPGGAAPGSMAALLASALLAACGGGGGGGSGSTAVASTGTAAASAAGTGAGAGAGAVGSTATATTGYLYLTASTDAEAARFLMQAQLSVSDDDIAAVRSMGYPAWLQANFDAPATQSAWDWMASKPYKAVNMDDMAWRQLMASRDGLRKRLALALSEIFVVSGTDMVTNWPNQCMAQYWDMLATSATRNFRQLLEDVTLNPAMGCYLNTKGNQKEDASGRQPDENYAREVMQLMTIGLYQLDPDGTLRRDAAGKPIDTYTLADVTNLARVFTGWDLDIRSSEWTAFRPPDGGAAIDSSEWSTRPMVLTASKHSTLAATFLGTTVPANTDGKIALKVALDTLFNHPNVGPFIGRQLIQRLVTSNPSPAYVARVAAAFANNGAGVRGDMKSVWAAVLLDNEARGPSGLTDPNFGRLREPMLRFVQWGRTFGIASALDTWKIGELSDPGSQLGQSPLRSSSVFNFFRPGYVPPSTALAVAGKVAPEFQIVNETSVGGYLNYMQNCIANGVANRDVAATYVAEKALAPDAAALVKRIDLLMCANQLGDDVRQIIVNALASPVVVAGSSDALKLNRVYAAILMVMAAPSYLIQK